MNTNTHKHTHTQTRTLHNASQLTAFDNSTHSAPLRLTCTAESFLHHRLPPSLRTSVSSPTQKLSQVWASLRTDEITSDAARPSSFFSLNANFGGPLLARQPPLRATRLCDRRQTAASPDHSPIVVARQLFLKSHPRQHV
ncbi:hypothetical protein LX32DRAFT_211422 [Colletotrichum zoysiae]|uniref:Uncharacterized protein n=1 Tax=Colletotrichum zoysiae TaxID=1216348 RepID=A0AAD9H5H1_9PEZI|nr:hypothetical protein LX32DRAFT_211422 [Colletotrichum zoysiae]